MTDKQTHIPEERLVAWLDGESQGQDRLAIEVHLSDCESCRRLKDELHEGAQAYDEFHHDVLKPSLPPPPKPWTDLHPVVRPAEKRRWLAVAAALVLAVFAGLMLWQTPKLNAAELLAKAQRRETPPSPRARIRVKTKSRNFVRPALLRSGERDSAEEVRIRFAAAQYSWEEPLSVRSYTAWRDQTARKSESVEVASENYLVRTAAVSGPLLEATLVLRVADLHPVRGIFRFEASGEVEISEEAPDPQPPVLTVTPAAAPTMMATTPTLPNPLALELQVMAALHHIDADLGDPIEILRQASAIEVVGTGLTPTRRQQVKDALADLPQVAVRFEDPQAQGGKPLRRAGSTTVPPSASALREDLEKRLGGAAAYEQFVNEALDSSDALMARAYALRALATRFPKDADESLAKDDRVLLESLRRDHNKALSAQWKRLIATLAAGMPAVANRQPVTTAVSDPAKLFTAAQRVDQALTTMADTNTLVAALRELEAQVQ
jgi:Putative zinc-finger